MSASEFILLKNVRFFDNYVALISFSFCSIPAKQGFFDSQCLRRLYSFSTAIVSRHTLHIILSLKTVKNKCLSIQDSNYGGLRHFPAFFSITLYGSYSRCMLKILRPLMQRAEYFYLSRVTSIING